MLTHCDDEPLRREFYEAWVTRASDQGPHAGKWNNTPLMDEILALRHEAANLVGFANFAEYSLATKMARDPDEVLEFLRRLARLSRPAAEREYQELETFAGRRLEAWDVAFYSEQLKRARLDVSEEELRPYFPLPRVLDGLFAVASRLYGIRIVARSDVQAYHPDVRYLRHPRRATARPAAASSSTCTRGPTSAAARGWTNASGGCRSGRRAPLPVAYLVCNFAPPVGERPSLLTHHEVLTLFHEFGHGLHHMLTRVDYPSVAGINGVPWDAVELPSQFMENFAWRSEVLPLISAHVDTGEPLPPRRCERLQATRSFQAGMQTVRQLEFALFDFRLHAEYSPEQAAAHCRDAGRGARRSRGRAARRPSTAFRTASSTSSPAAMRPATTATSGPRCSPPMPSARSRSTASSTSAPHGASCRRSSSAAAAATPWRPSSSSAAASPRSNRCCASSGWRPERMKTRARPRQRRRD